MKHFRNWVLGLGCLLMAGCTPSLESSRGQAGPLSPVESLEPISARSSLETPFGVSSDTASVARRVQDQALAAQVLLALSDVPELRAYLPTVEVRAGRVTLRGRVPSEALRRRAIQVAARVPGVVQVLEALEVETAAGGSATPVHYHTVRPGETLWDIARRYGLTVAELRRLNGLRGRAIRPGQRLRVR